MASLFKPGDNCGGSCRAPLWRWETCAITSLVELQYSCCFRQLFIKHKTFYCVFRAKRRNTHPRGLPAAHYFGFVAILTWRENPQGKIRPQLVDWFFGKLHQTNFKILIRRGCRLDADSKSAWYRTASFSLSVVFVCVGVRVKLHIRQMINNALFCK